MNASEFLAQHGPTLKSDHLDWLTALKDETMADVWDNTNDPLILVEIMRCLLNPNYDTALNEYLRDALGLFGNYCKSEIASYNMANAIHLVQGYIDATYSDKQFLHQCLELHKEVRTVLADANSGLSDKEKAALYSASFAINWLSGKDETAAVFAAYHATEHLIRSFDEGKTELSDKLRQYVGNPFS